MSGLNLATSKAGMRLRIQSFDSNDCTHSVLLSVSSSIHAPSCMHARQKTLLAIVSMPGLPFTSQSNGPLRLTGPFDATGAATSLQLQ